MKGQGEFLAHAKTDELKSQWIDSINHAKYAVSQWTDLKVDNDYIIVLTGT